MNAAEDEASGVLHDPLEGIGGSFSEMSVVHTSERNVVYRAKRYGRWWMLKGLRDAADTASMMALRKEFEIMVRLHHPGVAAAYALERVDGAGDCIVMEYAGSHTLGEWLAGAPDRSRRRRAAHRLLDALGYVHAQGVVHRDLKPANIIVGDLGEEIRLIDFGLADTVSHAHFKYPAGTKGYMSPEQEEGASAAVADDIYSLGQVLRKLDAGCWWNLVAKACLRRAGRRPAAVEGVRRKLRRYRAYGRVSASLAVSAAITLGAVWAWDATPRAEKVQTPPDTINAARIAVSGREATVPTPAGAHPRPTLRNTDGGEAVASRTALLRDASERGIRRLDARFDATAMRYLDTLSDEATFIYPVYPTDAFNAIINEYTASLRHDFSDAEVQTVYINLCLHLSERMTEWNNKREKIISQRSGATQINDKKE